jgi:hypothetical protein
MSKGKAIALAVVTAWPIVYIVLFICTAFVMIVSDVSGGGQSSQPPVAMMIILPLHFLTMLVMLALLAVYVADVFKTDRIAQDKKALWVVVLFLGNVIAMPVYWYTYIWKASK